MINRAGKAGHSDVTEMENFGGLRRSSKNKFTSKFSQEQHSSMPESSSSDNGESSGYYDSYLWFGSRGNGGRYPY